MIEELIEGAKNYLAPLQSVKKACIGFVYIIALFPFLISSLLDLVYSISLFPSLVSSFFFVFSWNTAHSRDSRSIRSHSCPWSAEWYIYSLARSSKTWDISHWGASRRFCPRRSSNQYIGTGSHCTTQSILLFL